jgi:hypothetical protein
MNKRKQTTNTISDQNETEHTDYQLSKGNIAQRLSMIKRKDNTKTISDQNETEHLIVDSLCVLFPFDH